MEPRWEASRSEPEGYRRQGPLREPPKVHTRWYHHGRRLDSYIHATGGARGCFPAGMCIHCGTGYRRDASGFPHVLGRQIGLVRSSYDLEKSSAPHHAAGLRYERLSHMISNTRYANADHR